MSEFQSFFSLLKLFMGKAAAFKNLAFFYNDSVDCSGQKLRTEFSLVLFPILEIVVVVEIRNKQGFANQTAACM